MRKLLILAILISTNCFAVGEWECIDRVFTCHTWRLWVPQGWVVSGDTTSSDHAYAMTYIPDLNHEWKLS